MMTLEVQRYHDSQALVTRDINAFRRQVTCHSQPNFLHKAQLIFDLLLDLDQDLVLEQLGSLRLQHRG